MLSFKKTGKQSIGKTRGGWNTKLHVVSANDKVVVGISLSGGECHDTPEGRKLLRAIGKSNALIPLLMDKAYEGDETRNTAEIMGYLPVVPLKSNRKEPWEYDKQLYKRRNVVERLFRRVYTRYDKLDEIYLGFVYFCFSFIWLN